jgi:hypothetical protein
MKIKLLRFRIGSGFYRIRAAKPETLGQGYKARLKHSSGVACSSLYRWMTASGASPHAAAK